eukprot:768362-Hanusia_phi.AAC.2
MFAQLGSFSGPIIVGSIRDAADLRWSLSCMGSLLGPIVLLLLLGAWCEQSWVPVAGDVYKVRVVKRRRKGNNEDRMKLYQDEAVAASPNKLLALLSSPVTSPSLTP